MKVVWGASCRSVMSTISWGTSGPNPHPQKHSGKKKADQKHFTEESRSVVWLLRGFFQKASAKKANTKTPRPKTQNPPKKAFTATKKSTRFLDEFCAKPQFFVMREKNPTSKISRFFSCVCALLFSLRHCSNETLVEQKSALDCRRVSRNFSLTRGQQKRSQQNVKKRNTTQHTIINKAFFGDAFFRKHTTSKNTIEIWLILPVVICLFQGLSHACLRITAFAGICAWLITSDVICRKNWRSPAHWIPWRNAKLIHEQTGFLRSAV